jgi:SNF2 family DNA or RNA helicase
MPRSQDFSPRTEAMPHQREAIEYVMAHPATALFDEQGLGKTKIVIDAFAGLMSHKEIDAALVVAPMTLLFNWEQEVRKHSHLVPVVLRGTRRGRKYRFLTGANFYIVNYEALIGHIDVFRKLCRSRRFAVALDESTRIKDPRTETAQAVLAVADGAYRRVIMTGTPVANRPRDLWAQFFFLDGGELLGASYEEFAARFDERSEEFAAELEALSDSVRSASIRRVKKDVLELPDKVFVSHDVELQREQRELYRRCADDLLVELMGVEGEACLREIDNLLEKLLRLVQIASNPGLINAHYAGPVAKFEALDDLVGSLLKDHEKLIVWSSFVDNVETVSRRLGDYGTLVIHGGVPIEDRSRVVTEFQEGDRHRVLVANPAAAREGLTLTRASAAVYLDRSFSLTDYLQSQDRIHRIGQDRVCEIHKLVARDTVDEYVDLVIDLKASIAQHIYRPMGDGRSEIARLLADKDELLHFLGEGQGG